MPAVPPVAGHDDNSRDFYGADPGQDKGKDKDKKDKDKKKDKGSDTGKLVAAGVGGAALGAFAASAFSDDGMISSKHPLLIPYCSMYRRLTLSQDIVPPLPPRMALHPRLLATEVTGLMALHHQLLHHPRNLRSNITPIYHRVNALRCKKHVKTWKKLGLTLPIPMLQAATSRHFVKLKRSMLVKSKVHVRNWKTTDLDFWSIIVMGERPQACFPGMSWLGDVRGQCSFLE